MSEREQQGCALQASERRRNESGNRLLGVAGIVGDALHREAPALARDADRIVIDGLLPVAGLMRSTLLADPLLVPARPSPLDGWASDEILRLVIEARIFGPQAVTHYAPNRSAAHCHRPSDRNRAQRSRASVTYRARQPARRFCRCGAIRPALSELDDNTADRGSHGELTTRLTIDVTPARRGRITVAALRRGLRVADILRAWRAGDFPDDSGPAQ